MPTDRTPAHVAPPHGTRARYVSREFPCRCGMCTRANTLYIAAWRAAQRPAEQLRLAISWDAQT